MLFLECNVKKPDALRATHVIAEVLDRSGQREQVVVEESFLTRRSGRTFLPVWFISQDRQTGLVQVELPQEATSGVNRLWVDADNTFVSEDEKETVP